MGFTATLRATPVSLEWKVTWFMSTLVPPSIPFHSFNLGTVSRQRSPFNLHRGDGQKDLPPLTPLHHLAPGSGGTPNNPISLSGVWAGGSRVGGPVPNKLLLPTHLHILPSTVHPRTHVLACITSSSGGDCERLFTGRKLLRVAFYNSALIN